MNEKLTRKKFQKNEEGIAPLIALAIIGVIGTVAGIGIYQFTQRPDVTYNITETGFSLAGVSVDSFALIAIGIAVIFIGLFAMQRKKK